MTDDEILAAYRELPPLVNNVLGFHELAEDTAKPDSLQQTVYQAQVYANGHVLARRVFSLSQRLDGERRCSELADALRPLRLLCAAIFDANAWVDDAGTREDEKVMAHALAYANGYELALRVIRLHDDLTTEP